MKLPGRAQTVGVDPLDLAGDEFEPDDRRIGQVDEVVEGAAPKPRAYPELETGKTERADNLCADHIDVGESGRQPGQEPRQKLSTQPLDALAIDLRRPGALCDGARDTGLQRLLEVP